MRQIAISIGDESFVHPAQTLFEHIEEQMATIIECLPS